MELHPTIHNNRPTSKLVKVTFTCKYRAPEPLSIKFFVDGNEVLPSKPYYKSVHHSDGWRGENQWHTLWNKTYQDKIYECRTITARGFTLGVLSTTLPEKGSFHKRN